MNRDDIIRMAKKADEYADRVLSPGEFHPDKHDVRDTHFAALVAAEKEQQMIRNGWRQCAKGQSTTQFCGLLEAAVAAASEAKTLRLSCKHHGKAAPDEWACPQCLRELRADNEALPVDAERYRWLRETKADPRKFDEAIDRERKEARR